MANQTDSDYAKLEQAMENQRAMNLNEMHALVKAAVAYAKPWVRDDPDLDGVLEGMQLAFEQKANDLLVLAVAICALRHMPREQIVIAVAKIWHAMQTTKADTFLNFRYAGLVQ